MKIENLEIRNKRRRLALVVSIGTLLFQMIAMVPLTQASSTLEITDWWVTPEPSKTYEDMIMQIQIRNKDSIDHTYDLTLSTVVESIYKGWGGAILSVKGIIKADDYVSVSIVLTPTDVPYGGRVKFQLTLISENPNPPPYYAVVDEKTKWVTIEKGELETTVDDIKSQISVLQSQMDDLNNKLSNLQTNLDKLQRENSDLKTRNEQLSSQLGDLQQMYDSLERDYNTVKKDYDSLQKASIPFVTTPGFQWLTPVFIATTVILAITTIFFATRKRQKLN